MTVGGHLGFWAPADSTDIFEREIEAKSFSYSPSYMDQQQKRWKHNGHESHCKDFQTTLL